MAAPARNHHIGDTPLCSAFTRVTMDKGREGFPQHAHNLVFLRRAGDRRRPRHAAGPLMTASSPVQSAPFLSNPTARGRNSILGSQGIRRRGR